MMKSIGYEEGKGGSRWKDYLQVGIVECGRWI